MAGRGAPIGNQNGTRQKRLLTEALNRELTQKPEDVLAIATKLIASAKEGQPWALSLIWDRVDGKAVQPIEGTVAHTHSYDEMLLALLNGRSPQTRDDSSAEQTTH